MSDNEEQTRRTSDKEMEIIAERAAKVALDDFFLILGIDITEPESLLELQSDFRHMRYMRELSGHIGKKVFGVTIQLIIGGFLLWCWLKAGLPVPEGIHLGD